MRQQPGRRFGPRVAYLHAMILLGFVCQLALAVDPLQSIPANVAGVLVVRDLGDLDARVQKLAAEAGLERRLGEFSLSNLLLNVGFEAGTWDTSKPVVVCLTTSELGAALSGGDNDEAGLVLGLVPADAKALEEAYGIRERRIRRVDTSEGRFYATLRDRMVFLSPNRKAIRMIRRVTDQDSLAATLDKHQRKLYRQSDVFAHVPMAMWREKLTPLVMLATDMLRLQVSAQKGDSQTETSAALLDWFVSGVRDAISNMETVSIAVKLEDSKITLYHDHTFAERSDVGEYLSQVRRAGDPMWTTLPDRPFVFLMGCDWRIRGKSSFARRAHRFILNRPEVAAELTRDQRQKILDQITAFYDQSRGNYFVLSTPRDRIYPAQTLGGYLLDDARKGLQELLYVQQNASKAMAPFVPGGCSEAKFETRNRSGIEYLEMVWDWDSMDEATRRELTSMYGPDVRLQQAVMDTHNLGYTIAEPPVGVWDLRHKKDGSPSSLADDPDVRRVRGALPSDANIVFMVDASRFLGWLRVFTQVAERSGEPQTSQPVLEVAFTGTSGPILGWAGKARKSAFSGEMSVDVTDVVRVVRLVREMKRPAP